MTGQDGSILDYVGILAVFFLVGANGFFVAAEFALVSVRRSRVAELAAAGRMNASALQRAVDNLDANLAATQLGITISSLALGWVGEPALAHLIEPLLAWLPGDWARTGSHAIAVVIAFVIITALHIVLGELAPKSLALQRSEETSLAVVRPLGFFLVLFKPAIFALNGMGNLVLRAFGLHPGTGESSFHSPQELKLLVAESQEAGLLNQVQQQLVERVLNIGERPISDVMTPRLDVEWFDADDSEAEILRTIRECRHEQLLVARGSIDEPIGMVLKKDLLDQVLDGGRIRPMDVIKQPLVLHEGTSVVRVLSSFKASPVHLAIVIDEYGSLEGIVTQTDLLEAIAGELPGSDEEPAIVVREDGSLLVDAMMPAFDAFEKLGLRNKPDADFHTLAGFALHQLQHIPETGEVFEFDGWRFEVIDMDGMRIDKILATRSPTQGADI
ncbi:hemolysin-related transporter-associated domain-containing protein (plasmid) [Rhizobium etli 8C-3]|uniref:CBS domain containing-hemolysin-like protein n=2 Tax=Rhizobium TaxID=379 RepID=A0A4V2VBF3_9HYPH|nr:MULTISPECIES: hemolysin family protein [Rhizobium]APO78513.1 hemolysin-related transporter-associated domain-containing protein [Rhizobium etli 8C-3]TCU24695.1 CBS domain containing-hemolysin-like protein [Rhizobium azibense]TCU39441.1 CBS domain containing-hemolysin-like protein [Rhizobium azibense]